MLATCRKSISARCGSELTSFPSNYESVIQSLATRCRHSHEPGSAGILAGTASDLAGRDAGAPRCMAREQVRNDRETSRASGQLMKFVFPFRSLKTFHANHYWWCLYDVQVADPPQRLIHGSVGGIVNHENQGHALAFVAFRLDNRRDANLRGGQDRCYPGECPRPIHHA